MERVRTSKCLGVEKKSKGKGSSGLEKGRAYESSSG